MERLVLLHRAALVAHPEIGDAEAVVAVSVLGLHAYVLPELVGGFSEALLRAIGEAEIVMSHGVVALGAQRLLVLFDGFVRTIERGVGQPEPVVPVRVFGVELDGALQRLKRFAVTLL